MEQDTLSSTFCFTNWRKIFPQFLVVHTFPFNSLSILHIRVAFTYAVVAQRIERSNDDGLVASSNLASRVTVGWPLIVNKGHNTPHVE